MLTPGKLHILNQSKFREVVHFRQYDLLLALSALLAAGLYLTFTFATAASVDTGKLLLAGSVSLGLGLYVTHLVRARHRIRVTTKNLKVDQTSLISQKARIPLSEIASVDVVRHPVFAQHYGHGGWLSGERYLSLTGRNGLRIETKAGESYFIGSRRAKELKRAISVAA